MFSAYTRDVGSAVLSLDGDGYQTGTRGGIVISHVSDVTFTSIVLRDYDYNRGENAALVLLNCQRIVIESLIVEGIAMRQANASILVIDEGSTVELRSVRASGLGSHPGWAMPGTDEYDLWTQGSFLTVAGGSNVTLTDAVLTGTSLAVGSPPSVRVLNSTLRAVNVSWSGFTTAQSDVADSASGAPAEATAPPAWVLLASGAATSVVLEGAVLADVAVADLAAPLMRADSGAAVTLSGCAISAVTVANGWGDVITSDAANTTTLAGSIPVVLLVTGTGSHAEVRNCSLHALSWPQDAVTAAAMVASGAATLSVRGSNFTAVGGSGTAVAVDGTQLRLEDVVFADFGSVSAAAGDGDLGAEADGADAAAGVAVKRIGSRAAVVVRGAGANITAVRTVWRGIAASAAAGNGSADAAGPAAALQVTAAASGAATWVSLDGCLFADVSYTGDGGGAAVRLTAPPGGALDGRLTGVEWRDVSAAAGALVLSASASAAVGPTVLRLNGNRFSNCSGGGAVALDCEGTAATAAVVTVDGVAFEGNDAAADGGALRIQGCTVCMRDSSFVNNTASGRGGAVAASGAARVEIQGGKLTDNVATDGGAVAATAAAWLSITGALLSQNFATASSQADQAATDNSTVGGGALYIESTPAEITGSRFEGNDVASPGLGAAVLVSGACEAVTIADCAFGGDEATEVVSAFPDCAADLSNCLFNVTNGYQLPPRPPTPPTRSPSPPPPPPRLPGYGEPPSYPPPPNYGGYYGGDGSYGTGSNGQAHGGSARALRGHLP
ncbi:hypothetical protein HYH03_006916 [Edaphochlamys debaryana]|uniref:Right handed beta helix domain-containing protein n=1 Tax=Edaphochlamys debaryana TaxID=47281 RepID=A0A836C0X2_9CHLO|nr:hypothetical protein HYH03_006916 [Edaphochlamys debaryana]|eukprot:KAG2494983.1 hypothetical protein HYH03_006916 [Edaphochlamys debaryana]